MGIITIQSQINAAKMSLKKCLKVKNVPVLQLFLVKAKLFETYNFKIQCYYSQ